MDRQAATDRADGHFLEPLTTLSYLAARTTRLRLGTGVLLAALRSPVVLARTAATLDALSGGRLDLGVGVGWQADEYDAVGVPFELRGRRLDECLEVCQLLWREKVASYSGETVAFERIHQMPKPVQLGGVPIWVSGTVNAAVMRPLARFGSGWIPWGVGSRRAAATDRTDARSRYRARRDPDEIAVVGSLGTFPSTARRSCGRPPRGTLRPGRATSEYPYGSEPAARPHVTISPRWLDTCGADRSVRHHRRRRG
jgi:probable F420-dependent oxidoreductase